MQPVGLVASLNVSKPLSTALLYDLVLYEDGLLFVHQASPSFPTGRTSLSDWQHSVQSRLTQLSSIDRKVMITDSSNLWTGVDSLRQARIIKKWLSFYDFKLEFTLSNNTTLTAISKPGRNTLSAVKDQLATILGARLQTE